MIPTRMRPKTSRSTGRAEFLVSSDPQIVEPAIERVAIDAQLIRHPPPRLVGGALPGRLAIGEFLAEDEQRQDRVHNSRLLRGGFCRMRSSCALDLLLHRR